MIQFLLTIGCGFVFAYGLASLARSPIAGLLIVLAAAASLVFVWQPALVTTVANWLGVGRGTDLVLYLWVLVSTAEFLLLHQKIFRQSRLITELARHVAIREAEPAKPPQPSGDTGPASS